MVTRSLLKQEIDRVREEHLMCNDPIVEEIRKARQAHAARFDYDLAKIYKDLKDSEQRSGRKVVSLAGSKRMRKKEKPRQSGRLG